MPELLFVYGTLMPMARERGGRPVRVYGRLWDDGVHPALVLGEAGGPAVAGLGFEVSGGLWRDSTCTMASGTTGGARVRWPGNRTTAAWGEAPDRHASVPLSIAMTRPRFRARSPLTSAMGALRRTLSLGSYRAVASRVKYPVVAATISYTLLSFGLTAILSRLLGSRRFGEYAVVITIAGGFRLFTSFSVESGIPKFIAEWSHRDPAETRAYYAAGLAARLAAGLTALLLAFVLSGPAARLYGIPHLAHAVAAAALYVCLLAPLASFFLACIQGQEQPGRWSVTTLANALLVLPAGITGALGLSHWGLAGLLLWVGAGWAAAAFASGLSARRTMGFTWAAPDWSHVRVLLPFLAPLWFGELIFMGTHVLLKSYLAVRAGPVSVGQFEIALTLLFQVSTLYGAIMIVFLPTWARLYAAEQGAELLESFSLARGAIIGVASAVGLVFALAGQWIVPLIFGHDQLGAVPAVRVMGLIMPLVFSGWVTLSVFVISNQTSVSARANLLWLAVVIPAGLFLIPRLGALGAALAFAAGYVAFTSYLVVRARPFFARLQSWMQRETH